MNCSKREYLVARYFAGVRAVAMEPSLELIFAKSKSETHNAIHPAVEVRNFPNNMNDHMVAHQGSDEDIAKSQRVALTQLTAPRVALWVKPEFLEQSFPNAATFVKAAIKLKNEVVQATWTRNGPRVEDPTMYRGVLGTAFLCFKAYLTIGNSQDLELFSEIVDTCCAAAPTAPDNVTFLCGQAGIYAMGAVAANFRNDTIRRDFFLQHFNRIAGRRVLSMGPADDGCGLPYELLNGRVGFLYAALFINKYLGQKTVPWTITGAVVDAVVAAGRAHGTEQCPLLYPWKARRYWGASHGVAGVIQVLLHFPLKAQEQREIVATLRYMMRHRYRRGNFRVSEEDWRGDRLVQWCHGGPGIAITLCKASQMYPREGDLHEVAKSLSEVVWKRGLLRRLGLCHGITGNAYVFLSLHKTFGGKQYVFRARQFAGWLYKHAKRLLSTGRCMAEITATLSLKVLQHLHVFGLMLLD